MADLQLAGLCELKDAGACPRRAAAASRGEAVHDFAQAREHARRQEL